MKKNKALFGTVFAAVLTSAVMLSGSGVMAAQQTPDSKIVLSATVNSDVYDEFGDQTFLYKISGKGLDPNDSTGNTTKDYTYYTSITIKQGEKTGSVTVPVWTQKEGDSYTIKQISTSRFKLIARDITVVSPDTPTSESTAKAGVSDASDHTIYLSAKLNTGESAPDGVKFEIIQPDGTPLTATKISDGVYQHNTSGSVTEFEPSDGLVMIRGNDGDVLSVGTYTIKVTSLPAGYEKSGDDVTLTIDKERPFSMHYALTIGKTSAVPYGLANYVYGMDQVEMDSHSTTVVNHITEGEKTVPAKKAVSAASATYVVTYNANGGHFGSDTKNTELELSYNYKDGTYTLADGTYDTPVNDGKTFSGWYYDKDGTSKAATGNELLADSQSMGTDHALTVYAKWE